MKNAALTLLIMTVVGSAGLSGQESAMARAQRTLPPEVFANLSTLPRSSRPLASPTDRSLTKRWREWPNESRSNGSCPPSGRTLVG